MDGSDDAAATWEQAVEELADRQGVAPTALDPPLGAVVDPEAAERVLESARRRGTGATVAFDYPGYRVELCSDGSVTVAGRNGDNGGVDGEVDDGNEDAE